MTNTKDGVLIDTLAFELGEAIGGYLETMADVCPEAVAIVLASRLNMEPDALEAWQQVRLKKLEKHGDPSQRLAKVRLEAAEVDEINAYTGGPLINMDNE